MSAHPDKELLAAHADDAAPEAERAGLAAHLAGCDACRKEVLELKAVSKLVADLPRAELPVGFMTRLERRRRAESSPAAVPVWGVPPLRLAAFAATGVLVCFIFFREVRYRLAPQMLGDDGTVSSFSSSVAADGEADELSVDAARRTMAARGAWSGMRQESAAEGAASQAAPASPMALPGLAKARLKDTGAPLESSPSSSNEEIHAFLEAEKKRMGIKEIVPPKTQAPSPLDGLPDQPVSKEEAMVAMRRMTTQLARLNRDAQLKRGPTIALGGGETPRMIGSLDGSQPLAELEKADAGSKLMGAAGAAGSLAMVRGADIRTDEPASFEPPAGARPTTNMAAKPKAAADKGAALKTLAVRGSWSATIGGLGQSGGAVITKPEDWADLWKRVGRAEPLPQVDFSKEMAVAVFGERDEARQRSMSIVSLSEDDGTLVIRYRLSVEKGSGPSAPYAAVVAARSDLPFSFLKVE